jgi:hypothetical protein
LPFRDGTPSHDHLGDFFAPLDATEFQRRFVAWVAKLTGAPVDVIAIDGKMLCGSSHKKGGKAAIHRVSALAQARIREAVNRNKKEKLTALLHHVTVDVLQAAFFALTRPACAGAHTDP